MTKGYGDTSSAAFQQVSDLAFQAVKLGQTTFPELAGSIGRVVPLSAELQVSQEELFGVMATGTGVTGGAAEVSTQLRGVLQSLLSPTAGMTTLLASMGLESGKALIEQQGLQAAIETVVGAAARAGAPLQDYVSSIEGQTLALALAGPQADTFTEKLAAMQTATGTTDQAFAEITGGINAAGFQFKQLWREVTVAAQRFGDELIPQLLKLKPTLTDMVEGLKATVQWFADLPAPVQKTILVAVGLVAALGPLLLVVGQMSLGVGALVTIVGTLAGGFAALVPRAAAAGAAVGASGTAAGASVGPMVAAKIAARNMWRAISGPVGIAIAVITAAVGAFKLLKHHIDEGSTAAANFARSQASIDSMTSAIAKLESEGKKVPQSLRDVLTHAEQVRDRMKEMAASVDETSESFTAMRDELEALAAKEMAAWSNAAEDAKERARELAASLPDTEVAMQNMVAVVRQFANEAKLTPDVLRDIAKQALALGIAVEDLPPELQNIVVSFDNMARAGRDAAEEEARLERESTRLKESIQALVDQFQGRGLIQSALKAAEAVRHVGGVSKLTADDHDQLRETVNGAIDAYQRMEQAVPPVVRGLADQLIAQHDVRETTSEYAEDVQALVDTWTGASLESMELVAAFETLTAEQLANDRVMAQMIGSYDSMREILGPFHEELEQLWQTHERLKTPLESNTNLTDRLMQAQVAATQAQAALNERLDVHRRALLNLPTDEAIAAFEELRTVWASLDDAERDAATDNYAAALRDAAAAGRELTAEEVALVEATAEAVKTTSQYEVALASLAGQLGGAAGQSLNLAISMLEANKNLKDGEQGFSDIRIGAAKASAVFYTLGDAIGGTAGKILSEVGNIAQAFATGGLIGGIIAGVGAAIKGIKSLFGGASEAELAGRKTAGAFRDAVIATLNDGQLAEAAEAALGAWRGNERGAQFLIGVRDAYLAVGKSAEEAQAAVTRLWKAEARGPEAVAAVQRELQVVLDQANALAEAEREITARNREIADGLLGIVDAGQAAFDPAQLEPYLAQMQELGLLTAEEAAALREMADEAHTDWQAMEEAARTYGVAMKTVVDEAGNKTQVLDESLLGLGHTQAKLTDEAGRLAAAWDLLAGEGAHTGAAIRGMTDEAQAFVTQALEMGIALPAAMQPMIEKMIEQGALTDQNGKKLTDLSQVPFAAPLTSGFDLLADKIQMLIIALGGPSGLSKAVEEMVTSAGLQTTELAGAWAAMTTDMKAQFGSFEAFVEFRAMVARAGVSFDTMQTRWAAMTEAQQQRYGTFEAYVRERVLRKMARDAGLAWKGMRTDWAAMTDAQQRRYGTFEAYVRNQVLRKMAREAGLKWKDMRDDWKGMTDDQQAQFGNFETFVQTKLDDIAKRDEVTTSVGVTYVDPGFAVDDQTMTVHVRYDDPGFTPSRARVSAQQGTPFRHFGTGTPAMLHGLERVMTAQEGRGIAAVIGNIQRSLGAIADLSGVAALAQRVAPVAAMAAGGMGTVTAPTLFLAGEAGPEQFAFSGSGRRFGNETRDSRREASDLGALRQKLADLKRIMERGQDELPFRLSRAMRDAVVGAG